MSKKLEPIHPGEILQNEFLIPFGLSQYRVAKDIGVPPRRINEIVLRERAVSVDTALRLARYFKTSASFWLSLQSRYELECATDDLGPRIRREVREFSLA